MDKGFWIRFWLLAAAEPAAFVCSVKQCHIAFTGVSGALVLQCQMFSLFTVVVLGSTIYCIASYLQSRVVNSTTFAVAPHRVIISNSRAL